MIRKRQSPQHQLPQQHQTRTEGTPLCTAVFTGTPDGSFGMILDSSGAVVASGWTDELKDLLDRMKPQARVQAAAGVVVLEEQEASGPVAAALAAVCAYYAGEAGPILQVPVFGVGTDLQRVGWELLRSIPAGSPLTYTEFAAALGRPGAVRAVASVCAKNPTALFVPCHRVLRMDGGPGGFAWGEEVKRSLLEREAGMRLRA